MNIIHTPLCPSAIELVSYNIYNDDVGVSDIIELYHTVYNITIKETEITRQLLKTWDYESIDDSLCEIINGKKKIVKPLSYEINHPYGENKWILYEVILKRNGITDCHLKVNFVTSGFLIEYQFQGTILENPLPVYAPSDVNKVMNCVFIREQNLDIQDFYKAVASTIKDVFHTEPLLAELKNNFNFFIQNKPGIVVNDNPLDFSLPKDCNNSFAKCIIILHSKKINGYASYAKKAAVANYMRMNEIIHEISHLLYELKDEYDNNGDYNCGYSEYNNVWRANDIVDMNDIEDQYLINAVRINEDIPFNFYKICNDNCVMNCPIENFAYDYRCKDRMYYVLYKRFFSEFPFDTNTKIKVGNDSFFDLSNEISKCPFDLNYINDLDNRHITFDIIVEDGLATIAEESLRVMSGVVPFLTTQNANIKFVSNSEEIIYEYYLENDNTESGKKYNVVMPFDDKIDFMELSDNSVVKEKMKHKTIPIDDEDIKYKIDLNINTFKGLFQ